MMLPTQLLRIACLLACACSISGVAISGVAISGVAVAEDAELLARGKKIYLAKCAACHGDRGQGVADHYSDPLIGEDSMGELTKLVAETMPEEEPETCVGEEAAAVAYYIHHAFYSPAAQLRNRPPQIQFSRLTAAQLRQSIADLYGHFQDDSQVEQQRGILGMYYDGDRAKSDKQKLKRIDPVLDFDFASAGPGEGIDAKEFFIEWAGALKVDHTGRYEIVLRTACSTMMYFGHRERELVNNHVQSEGKTEFRRTLTLTAGRAYPIRIEFKQRKRKTKQPPASISLAWVTPGGVEEIIPTRNLIPVSLPATFSLQTKLPPDDRSYGYERGTSIDRGWDDSTTAAAIEFAQIAIDELYPSYRRRHRNDSDDNRAKLRGFLKQLVETAFRGPIDDEIEQQYIDRQLAESEDDAEAIKRVCLIALKSPRFLYPALETGRSKSQRVANRLALTLFDSLPSDSKLITVIKQDRLKSDQEITAVAQQMVQDFRAQAKLRAFLYHWFDLGDIDEITKDSEQYPGFDRQLVSDLRKSFDAMLDEIALSEASDFRQLFQADWAFTSDRMTAFYGDRWKAADNEGPSLRRTNGHPETRIGLLGHPLVMSHLAYHNASSPIHRGVFLIRHTLGRVLRPPDAAFTPIDPDLHPQLTTRERVELQTGEVNCQVCHAKINALGFALENYDAAGRFRTQEREQAINPQGAYTTRSDERVSFGNPRELANFLADSDDCQRAFVESAFEYFVKQPIAAFGADTIDRLMTEFRESGFNIRKLLVAIAVTAANQEST